MSGQSIEHNRRAVYGAFDRVVGDRLAVQQAMGLWEARHASSKVFRVTQFIDDVVAEFGLSPDKRRDVAVAIYANLGRAETDLAPVPESLLREAGGVTVPAAVNGAATPRGSAADQVFGHVLSFITDGAMRAAPSDIADLRDALAEFAGTVGLDSPEVASLSSWANDDFDPARSPLDFGEKQMHFALHAVYLAVCDVLGPARADRLLSGALRSASEIPAAEDFAPARLT